LCNHHAKTATATSVSVIGLGINALKTKIPSTVMKATGVAREHRPDAVRIKEDTGPDDMAPLLLICS
jgi:hypothetical protein